MHQVRYIGRNREGVDLDAPVIVDGEERPGLNFVPYHGTIEVSKDVAESLLIQEDNWEPRSEEAEKTKKRALDALHKRWAERPSQVPAQVALEAHAGGRRSGSGRVNSRIPDVQTPPASEPVVDNPVAKEE